MGRSLSLGRWLHRRVAVADVVVVRHNNILVILDLMLLCRLLWWGWKVSEDGWWRLHQLLMLQLLLTRGPGVVR